MWIDVVEIRTTLTQRTAQCFSIRRKRVFCAGSASNYFRLTVNYRQLTFSALLKCEIFMERLATNKNRKQFHNQICNQLFIFFQEKVTKEVESYINFCSYTYLIAGFC